MLGHSVTIVCIGIEKHSSAGLFKEWITVNQADKSLSNGYNVLQLTHFSRWIEQTYPLDKVPTHFTTRARLTV